jgi:hypothetical protein
MGLSPGPSVKANGELTGHNLTLCFRECSNLTEGQGELAHTLVLTAKWKNLGISIFRFDSKFGFKSIKSLSVNSISNQQGQK